MKKLFAWVLVLLPIFGGSPFSETLPSSEMLRSPDVRSLMKLESEYFALSSFPNDVIPVEVIRVDMYGDFQDKLFVEALFTPFCIPENLYSVILTDGTHIARATFEAQGDTLWLYFYVPDLMRFDSTTGLWLVLIEQVT